jgi:hypothetical protein
MLKRLALLTLSLGACSFLNASTLYVQTTGLFSSTDTADSFITPGDTFKLSFVVNSSPVISASNSTTLSFDLPVIDFSYYLNGVLVPNAAQPSEITFYTAADGGGFEVAFGQSAEFLINSSQIFSGTTTAPSFSAGIFSNQSFLFLDNNNVDTNAASVSVTPTPEPSSILLLLCGASLVAVGFRKSARVR